MTTDELTGAPAGPATDGPVNVAPRLRLDELLEELVGRAGEVLASRDALRKLLTANRSIMAELSLPDVLRRVIEAACGLVGARYGALGVIGVDGRLEQFVHTGMDPAVAAAIGPLPQGQGLLGALIVDPSPIRISDISSDPRSAGFPAHHPPMNTFLGVPIRLRDAVYGNLYLTESLGGEFTEEDTELLTALSGTAAIAIENARLFQESQRRQQWLQASTRTTRRLLTSPRDDAMAVIADQVRQMADADVVTVVLPAGPDHLVVAAASGEARDKLAGTTYLSGGSLSQLAIGSGESVRLSDAGDPGMPAVYINQVMRVGPVMAIPLVGSGPAGGALVVARLVGRAAFSVAELDMASTFANHAAVALELADARAAKDRLTLLEDRDRIARDLHDHVIQRLFAAGLSVQSLIARTAPPVSDRLDVVVQDIDQTIKQIRTTIFALHTPIPSDRSPRSQLLELIDAMTASSDLHAAITFEGPVDTAVPASLVDDLRAVVREALANVAKHAHATRASVALSVTDTTVRLEVTDDGDGPGDSRRSSGLSNLRQRAHSHGGEFTINAADPHGTTLSWAVPLA